MIPAFWSSKDLPSDRLGVTRHRVKRWSVEFLERRLLFSWIGAVTGSTNDLAHQYDNTANWTGGVILDSFAGIVFTGSTTLYLAGNRTTTSSGLNLGYSGSFDLAIKSNTVSTPRTLTLAGNISGTFGGDNVTLGDTTNPVNVALSGATRTVTIASGQTLSILNVLSGSFGLTKAGPGTLTLSGVNTYTGVTTLSAGRINSNSARAFGTGALAINGGSLDNTSGAPITLNNNAQTWGGDFTFVGTNSLSMGTGAVTLSSHRTVTVAGSTFTTGGIVSGAFSLTKTGAGALTLAGANTFSGGVVLSTGQLNLNSTRAIGTGPFTVNGGSIDNTSGAAITLTSTNATVWNADIVFIGSANLGFGTGAITLGADREVNVGARTLTLSGIVGDAGISHQLVKSGGGTLTLAGVNTFSGGVTLSAGQLNINNARAIGTGTFQIDGGTIDNTTAASITLTSNNPQIWNGDFTFTGTRSLNFGSGAVTMSGNRVVNALANTLTVAGVIAGSSGTSGLTKSGTGTLSLTAANTFGGNTTINAGTLNFATGGLGAGLVEFGGSATLQWNTGNTQDISASLAAIGNGVVATLDTLANTVSLGSPITGDGAIVKVGTGVLALAGANLFTGGTTLTLGTLALNHASALGTGMFTINGGSINNTTAAPIAISTHNSIVWGTNVTFTGTRNLDLGDGDVTLTGNRTVTTTASTLAVGGVISGGFALSKAGNGALTLSNANTYTGGTSLTAGTLNINDAAAIGSGTFTITGGTINNTSGSAITLSNDNAITVGGTITFAGTNALNLGGGDVTLTGNRSISVTAGVLAIDGTIAGAFSLTKAGAGTLALNGSNSYTGGTTLSAGTLGINTPTAIGTGTFAITGGTIDNTSGAVVTLSTNNAQTWGGTVTVANTFPINLGDGPVTLTGNRTITVSAGTFTVAGEISSAFSLTKSGAGALTLTELNTYTGGTIISAGTLNANTSSAIGTGSLTLTAGALDNTSGGAITLANNQIWGGNFAFAGTNPLTFSGNVSLTGNRTATVATGSVILAGTISGAFGFTKAGAGAMTLAGANTYTGTTTLSAGRLNLNTATAVGTGVLSLTGGVLDNTSGGAITLTSNNAQSWGGNFTFDGTNNLNLGTGNVTLTANRIVTTTAGLLTLGGTIAGSFSITKAGAGTLRVTGTSTFTAGVIVNGGTIEVNNTSGSGTGTGAVAVNNGGTLAGTGRVSGSVTVNSGGVLSPGANGGTAIFSTGSLVLAAGSRVDLTLNGNVAGSDYDAVNVTGTVNLGTSTLNLSGTRDDHDSGSLTIITNDLADFATSTFQGFPEASTVAFNGVDYTINYRLGTGNDVALTARLATTATAIAEDSATTVFGETVTFTATITSTSSGTPTGSVTFFDNGSFLDSVTVDVSGIATVAASSLGIGGHLITASYSGDSNFTSSASAAAAHTVSQAATTTVLQASPSATVTGELFTLTASVSVALPGNGVPTGTITFKDGGTVLGTAALDGNGEATFDITPITASSHSFVAVYSGDTNRVASTSAALSHVVSRAATTTTLSSSDNSAEIGQPVTFIAGVTIATPGDGVATGTITFRDGAAVLGSATLDGTGVATFAVDFSLVGSHAITAVYAGDADYAASTSTAVSQSIAKASTTTSLSSSVNASIYGQPTTFVATVLVTPPGGGLASGVVRFKDGATLLGIVPLDVSGQASFETDLLNAGRNSIIAEYAGDASFDVSVSPAVSQVVNASATSTGLSSVGPLVVGELATFTATVVALAPGAGTPSGTVTFREGSTTLGTGPIDSSGEATFSIAALALGAHTITAFYSGSSNYAASTSAGLSQAVSQSGTTTAVVSSSISDTSVFGQTVTFTVTVAAGAPGSGMPTGTVTFKDDAWTLATATLNSAGVATFSTSALAVAQHSITAEYGGDANYLASVSPLLTQTVNLATTTAILSLPATPSALGQSITFSVTVAAALPGGGTPGGTVFFKDGSITLGPATLNGSGVAMFSTSAFAAGNHSITVVYGGDANFAATVSSAAIQLVQRDATSVTLNASAGSSAVGEPLTLTATVISSGAGGPTPMGVVTFMDGGNILGTATLNRSGIATLTTSSLQAGTHAITAIYAGSANLADSRSPEVLLVVNAPPANAAPSVVAPARALSDTVLGIDTELDVLGTDDAGESNLTYSWSLVSGPAGSSATFSANGTNASKHTEVAFDQAGDYDFSVTLIDSEGKSETSRVHVTVFQTLTAIRITPGKSIARPRTITALTARAFDQFGERLSPEPGFAWSIQEGSGTVNDSGQYQSPGGPTKATIQAFSNGIEAAAFVEVFSESIALQPVNIPPTSAMSTSVSPSSAIGLLTNANALAGGLLVRTTASSPSARSSDRETGRSLITSQEPMLAVMVVDSTSSGVHGGEDSASNVPAESIATTDAELAIDAPETGSTSSGDGLDIATPVEESTLPSDSNDPAGDTEPAPDAASPTDPLSADIKAATDVEIQLTDAKHNRAVKPLAASVHPVAFCFYGMTWLARLVKRKRPDTRFRSRSHTNARGRKM